MRGASLGSGRRLVDGGRNEWMREPDSPVRDLDQRRVLCRRKCAVADELDRWSSEAKPRAGAPPCLHRQASDTRPDELVHARRDREAVRPGHRAGSDELAHDLERVERISAAHLCDSHEQRTRDRQCEPCVHHIVQRRDAQRRQHRFHLSFRGHGRRQRLPRRMLLTGGDQQADLRSSNRRRAKRSTPSVAASSDCASSIAMIVGWSRASSRNSEQVAVATAPVWRRRPAPSSGSSRSSATDSAWRCGGAGARSTQGRRARADPRALRRRARPRRHSAAPKGIGSRPPLRAPAQPATPSSCRFRLGPARRTQPRPHETRAMNRRSASSSARRPTISSWSRATTPSPARPSAVIRPQILTADFVGFSRLSRTPLAP